MVFDKIPGNESEESLEKPKKKMANHEKEFPTFSSFGSFYNQKDRTYIFTTDNGNELISVDKYERSFEF